MQLGVHQSGGALVDLLDAPGIHDDHDCADQGATRVHGAEQDGGARIAEVVIQNLGIVDFREGFDGFAYRVVFIRPHGTLGQPEHLALVVVKGDGVNARGLDGLTHFLANGVEVNERAHRA